jgi:hypothetical protein
MHGFSDHILIEDCLHTRPWFGLLPCSPVYFFVCLLPASQGLVNRQAGTKKYVKPACSLLTGDSAGKKVTV